MTSDDAPGSDLQARLQAGLTEMAVATDRLLESVDRLDDAALHEPSLLPGWTRGHVLSHVARNADALVNLVHAARTGDPGQMYPGGREQRDADIEAGAARRVGDQRLDVAESAERLLDAFVETFPAAACEREVTMASGASAYGWEIPMLRVREVAIHHVDLDAGYTPDDWPEGFAARTLDQLSPLFRDSRDCPVGSLVATDADRAWEVASAGPALEGATAALAAWLVGRSGGAGLRLTAPGEVPAAPRWA